MVREMGIYNTAKEAIKDAVSLAQQSDNIQLYKSVLDAYNATIELMSENNELREEVTLLKNELNIKKNIVKIEDAYYVKLEDESLEGPYCMHCYDANKTLVHYQIVKYYNYPEAVCPECKLRTSFYNEQTKRPY